MTNIDKNMNDFALAVRDITKEINQSLKALGAEGNFSVVETLKLIAPYIEESRAYHGLAHATNVADTKNVEKSDEGKVAANAQQAKIADAIRTFAGLGHDTVYYGVDGKKVPDIARPTMERYFEGYQDGVETITLKQNAPEGRENILKIATEMFGFDGGRSFEVKDQKNFKGFNEFASALVIMDILQDAGVEEKYLAMVAQAIAATVPFVGKEKYGKSHPGVLRERLTDLNATLNLGLTQEDIDLSTRLAVDIGNKDVSGFAGGGQETREDRLQYFLENTWQLMYENNSILREGHPSAEQYFDTMRGNAGFVNAWLDPKAPFLDVENIFHQITIDGKAFPPQEHFIELQNTAREVLGDGGVYLNAKVASAGVVLALQKIAEIDEPLKDLMQGVKLSETTLPKNVSLQDITVSALLKDRGKDPLTSFDVARSPIAEFMFNNASLTLYQLTSEGRSATAENLTRGHLMKDLATRAIAMREGTITPEQYLKSMEAIIGKDNAQDMISSISTSIADGDINVSNKIQSALRAGRSAA